MLIKRGQLKEGLVLLDQAMVKKKYEPDHLFRVNRNIRPDGALSPAA